MYRVKLLILLLFPTLCFGQLQNYLSALNADSAVVLLGRPETTTDAQSIITNLAVATDSIMSSLQKYGKQDGNYASLASAVTDAASDTALLVISKRHSITSNTTISGQTALFVHPNGRFNVTSGDTLTISVPLIAGNYQIFEGSGVVVFGANAVVEVNPLWFGVQGDGSTDDLSAFQKAFASILTNKHTIKIPRKNYILSSRLVLDNYDSLTVVNDGNFQTTAGDSATIQIQNVNHLIYTGKTEVDRFIVNDAFHSRFENVNCDSIIIKPIDNAFGTFWNTFQNIRCEPGALTIDVETHGVNQNLFLGGYYRGLSIMESAANSKDCHGNVFLNVDFSSGWIRNTTGDNQMNSLISCYIETVPSGFKPIGYGSNFNVVGMAGDVTTTFQTKFHNWQTQGVDHIGRLGDYAPIGYNMFENGDLRYYPESGQPDGFAGQGSVATDSTAPNQSKRVIRVTSTAGQTFRSIQMTVNGVDSPTHTGWSVIYRGYMKALEAYVNGVLQYTLTPDSTDTTSWSFLHGSVAANVGDTVKVQAYNVTTAESFNANLKIAYVSFTPVRVSMPFAPTPYGDFRDGGDRAAAARTLGNVDSTNLAFLTDDKERLLIQADGDMELATGKGQLYDDPFSFYVEMGPSNDTGVDNGEPYRYRTVFTDSAASGGNSLTYRQMLRGGTTRDVLKLHNQGGVWIPNTNPHFAIFDLDNETTHTNLGNLDTSTVAINFPSGIPKMNFYGDDGKNFHFTIFADTLIAVNGTDTLRVVPSR